MKWICDKHKWNNDSDGLEHGCSISTANVLKILQSCTMLLTIDMHISL